MKVMFRVNSLLSPDGDVTLALVHTVTDVIEEDLVHTSCEVADHKVPTGKYFFNVQMTNGQFTSVSYNEKWLLKERERVVAAVNSWWKYIHKRNTKIIAKENHRLEKRDGIRRTKIKTNKKKAKSRRTKEEIQFRNFSKSRG